MIDPERYNLHHLPRHDDKSFSVPIFLDSFTLRVEDMLINEGD